MGGGGGGGDTNLTNKTVAKPTKRNTASINIFVKGILFQGR